MGNRRSSLDSSDDSLYVRRPLPQLPSEFSPEWPVTACRAIFDRQAVKRREFSFKKGDVFITLQTSGTWWLVRHPHTMKKAYVPCNFVEPVEWLENQPWYFGRIQRHQAETLLSMEGNQDGDFLVRRSETNPQTYALSLLVNGEPKHYRILRYNGRYFISNWCSFLTVQELIRHHQVKADGLRLILRKPCLPPPAVKITPEAAVVTSSRNVSYQMWPETEPRYSVDPTTKLKALK